MLPVKGIVIVFALLSFGATIASIPTDDSSGYFRVYSKNLRYDNARTADLFADFSEAGLDAVMLQEVSSANSDLLDMLKKEFPFQHLCPSNSSIALL